MKTKTHLNTGDKINRLTVEATRIENHLQRIVLEIDLLKIKREKEDTEDMRRITELAKKCSKKYK